MPQSAIGKASEFTPGTMRAVVVAGKKLVIFCLDDGSFSALDDRCSHAEVKLSRGDFADGVVTCVAHGARFDCKTGVHLCMPAVKGVKAYPVVVVGEDLLVELP